MFKDLSLLIQLQKLDLEIDKNRKKKGKLSFEIEGEHKKIAEVEKDLFQKQNILRHTQIKKREKERKIEEIDLLLAKHEEEKYKVKSKEEFSALEKEISQVEEEKEKVEDFLLELMEKEEELVQNLPFLEVKVKQIRKDCQKKGNILKLDLDNVIHRIRQLENSREKIISQLDSIFFQRYEQLRKTREGLAVVSVKNGICDGCNVRISPSLMARVRRGEEIVCCENCSRILYISELQA